MAIFNNSALTNKSSKPETSTTTIITTGAKIQGELEMQCNLYIDGEIEGSIVSTHNINVGKEGHIKGSINAQRLVVQGEIDGKINAEIVEIKSTGHIRGEICANELIIEAKGIFEGNSIKKQEQPIQPALTEPEEPKEQETVS